jgi:RNA polymerase sigma-70 factor (ECF subfamily)
LSNRIPQIRGLVSDSAKRLVARATDSYGVGLESVSCRVQSVVEKYLLRDDESASTQVITDFIDKLQADDLCLIIACEEGNPTAWEDLVERFSTTVRSAARSASSNEEGAEDLAQSIWAELHGLRKRADGRPSGKLSYYSGRGSLAGWLRAVVAQLAVDQHRKQSRFVQTEEDAEFDRIAQDNQETAFHTTNINPEVETSRKAAAAEMHGALTRVIKQLPPEDRLLVKLYYFDDLRLREAGAVLGVHEATASRRLARVHSALRTGVEEILIKEKGWSASETARAFADVALHLETDIEAVLSSGGVPFKEGKEIAT